MTGTIPPSSTDATLGRRGLPPSIIAFIVFDVLLVIAAVALAFSLGSDDADAAGSKPQSSASASASDEPSADATSPDEDTPSPSQTPDPLDADAKQVASPTGNITCTLSPEGAECAIASLAAEPAATDGCEGSVGYVVTLGTSGVDTPCVTDQPSEAGADVPVLGYGDAVAVNNFECVSTESGMKCSNTNTGQGFTLARAGVTRF